MKSFPDHSERDAMKTSCRGARTAKWILAVVLLPSFAAGRTRPSQARGRTRAVSRHWRGHRGRRRTTRRRRLSRTSQQLHSAALHRSGTRILLRLSLSLWRVGAVAVQHQRAIGAAESVVARFRSRRESRLRRRFPEEQRPAQPDHPGRRSELCRTGEVGAAPGEAAGNRSRCEQNAGRRRRARERRRRQRTRRQPRAALRCTRPPAHRRGARRSRRASRASLQTHGLPAANIQTDPDSIPAPPRAAPTEDAAKDAAASNPAVQAAVEHARAQYLRAQGEHRALWPSIDFAAQYALLSKFNNFQNYYIPSKPCITSLGEFLCVTNQFPAEQCHRRREHSLPAVQCLAALPRPGRRCRRPEGHQAGGSRQQSGFGRDACACSVPSPRCRPRATWLNWNTRSPKRI